MKNIKPKNTKSELSIRIDEKGNITTSYNANLEDLRQMTNALISGRNKTETKIFVTAISTILTGYKSVVFKKK